MKVTLYQKHLTGRLKHMAIEVKSNQIFTEWWTSKEEEDGKKQNTKETISGKNKGRSNETSDNEQAILEFERKIKRKKEEGYVENREDAVLGEEAVVSSVLTQAFAPSKPISKLKEKDEPYDGNWLAERKHNGSCILLHNTGNQLIGYTRRIKPITEILSVIPQIQECLKLLPEESLVIGELVAIDSKGIEDPKVLKAVTTETTTETKALAKYNSLIEEGYKFDYNVFDILFWNGEDVTELPFTERLQLTDIFGKREVTIFTEDMMKEAIQKNWEGFILRRPDDIITFTMNGKPKRKGSYKFKFIETTDCIVTKVCPGSGKHEVRFARFRLAQYENSPFFDEPVIVDCGWAGGGRLGEENMDLITADLIQKGYELKKNNLEEKDWFVVELEYQSRQSRNDKGQLCFEFPIIIRTREDKPLNECEV
jgi:ATP-dependent DNA ligase|tara:strand:+ start:80 stop:1354 length:1275 start_codon:yes stop_codon:yes gene_type:complete